MKLLINVEEASRLIKSGKGLMIAGDEKLLRLLPLGHWIGGTIPYFMSEDGGICTESLLHVTLLTDHVNGTEIKMYTAEDIHQLPLHYPNNGMSLLIIPAFSTVHRLFAEECSAWSGIFDRPLIGWVSGTNLSGPENVKAKVFNGSTGECSDELAVAMHVNLDEDVFAKVGIINLFQQGEGDTITFPGTGFEASNCFVNGKEVKFSDYIIQAGINTQQPLVASYMGAMINVSIQDVMNEQEKVKFFAPVFQEVEYRFASPIGNYAEAFELQLAGHSREAFFTCNCVLNYLYAKLEGKKTGHFNGPMTFGEIAYMLLNQTLVYVTIEKKSQGKIK